MIRHSVSYQGQSYFAAHIRLATYHMRCLQVDGSPEIGAELALCECPSDRERITMFLVPDDNSGQIRLVSHPFLCLYVRDGLDKVNSSEGLAVHLWLCDDAAFKPPQVASFRLQLEDHAWLKYDHWDFPDRADIDHEPVHQLGRVIAAAERYGAMGFSVRQGVAWLKGRGAHLSKDKLEWMGKQDVAFYLRRYEGDFTVRWLHGLCLATPALTADNDTVMRLMRCPTVNELRVEHTLQETRLKIHFWGLTIQEEQWLHNPQGLNASMCHMIRQHLEPEQHPQAARVVNASWYDGALSIRALVKLSLTIQNLDYGSLEANPVVLANLSDTIKEAVAQAVADVAGGDITAENVTENATVELLPRADYLKVTTSIALLDHKTAKSVESGFQGYKGASSKFRTHIASRLNGLPGIAEVRSGYLLVGNVTAAAQSKSVVHWDVFQEKLGCREGVFWDEVQHGASTRLVALAGLFTLFLLLAVLLLYCCLTSCPKSRPQDGVLAVNGSTNLDDPVVWRVGRIVANKTDRGTALFDVDVAGISGRPALGYYHLNNGAS